MPKLKEESLAQGCESPIEILFAKAYARRMKLCLAAERLHRGKAGAIVCHGIDDSDFQSPGPCKTHSDFTCIEIFHSQFRMPPFRADFAIQRIMRADRESQAFASPVVIVECDGHEFHERTAEQATRDRRRDRAMAADGYAVLRFTGRELFKDADACAEEVDLYIEAQCRRHSEMLATARAISRGAWGLDELPCPTWTGGANA